MHFKVFSNSSPKIGRSVELTTQNCPALAKTQAGEKVTVTAETFQNLQAAQSINRIIKDRLLPKGAPNQALNLWETEGRNWAVLGATQKDQMCMTRQAMSKKTEALRNGHQDDLKPAYKDAEESKISYYEDLEPFSKGLGAIELKTGKCGEHAQVAFDLSMDKDFLEKLGTPIAPGSTVMLVRAQEDHNYVLVCAPGSVSKNVDGKYSFDHPNSIVVLDAWVPYPTAHTLNRSDPEVINSNPKVLASYNENELPGIPFYKIAVKVSGITPEKEKKILRENNLPSDTSLRDIAALERCEKTFITASSAISGYEADMKISENSKKYKKEDTPAKLAMSSGMLHSMLYDNPFSTLTPADTYVNETTNEEKSFAFAEKGLVKKLGKSSREKDEAQFSASPNYLRKAFSKAGKSAPPGLGNIKIYSKELKKKGFNEDDLFKDESKLMKASAEEKPEKPGRIDAPRHVEKQGMNLSRHKELISRREKQHASTTKSADSVAQTRTGSGGQIRLSESWDAMPKKIKAAAKVIADADSSAVELMQAHDILDNYDGKWRRDLVGERDHLLSISRERLGFE
jgi:hypothetical protein